MKCKKHNTIFKFFYYLCLSLAYGVSIVVTPCRLLNEIL